MTEIKHHHHPDEGPHQQAGQDNSTPYWKRAHKDWRFWVGVGFIFAALAIYIVSVDLSLVPRAHPGSLSTDR
jgi:hypothetical protein